MFIFFLKLLINSCLVVAPEDLKIRCLSLPIQNAGINTVLEKIFSGKCNISLVYKQYFISKYNSYRTINNIIHIYKAVCFR